MIDTDISAEDFQVFNESATRNVRKLDIASATVVERGDVVGITSGLLVRASASTAKIGIALGSSANGDTDDVPVICDGIFYAKADAVFAVTNRNTEVDLVILPGYMETGVVTATVAVLAAITDASFRATFDGTARNVDALDLSSGTPTTYAAIAALIQAAVRIATSALETVTYSTTTGRFKFASVAASMAGAISALTTSTGTVGTDVSGSSYFNGDSGAAIITDPRYVVDLGASTTDVFIVEPGTDAGTVGSEQNIKVQINPAKKLF